jgi:alkaline phosphatase
LNKNLVSLWGINNKSMNYTIVKFLCFSFLLTIISCNGKTQIKNEPNPASKDKKFNIIFLIGDGMGLSQLSSAYFYGDKEPNFSRFPYVGLSKTRSGSHKITDSAAGATAFSTGKKTYNGAIGVDMDSNAVVTISEELAINDWSIGFVSTSSITHATPASFYSHVPSRIMQLEIAKELVYSDVDFIAGGGYGWFINRPDSVNYFDTLVHEGFFVDTNSVFTQADNNQSKLAYLLARDGLQPKHLGRDDFLTNATTRAIDFLDSKDKPFFLMIEGSQIDWGGHANIGEYVIQEVLDFDLAVGAALDYASKQGNTLVVVTADHETGGFTMASEQNIGPFMTITRDYNTLTPVFSTGGHSCTMVPVLAAGPYAEKFSGIYENTNIHSIFKDITLKEFQK